MTSRYWLDVEVFETTIAHCHDVPGQDLTLDQAAALEQVIELYTGDLLEGIYDDWCLYDRERLSVLYSNALGKLMSFHEVNGHYERGLFYGERILARDDTRDKVHRQMMRLHWLIGDRNAALEQYRRCEQILRETLGITPVEETTRLYQNILHNQLDPKIPPDRFDALPSAQATTGKPRLLTAQHLSDRLHRLHILLEEASLELSQIEHFISDGPSDSEPS